MDPILYNAALKVDIKVFKNIEQLLSSLLTPSGNTVLHIYITSLDKNSKSMTKFVKELLTMCPSLLWKTNANDETLLYLGARYGRIIITKFLIEQANTLSDQDLESGTDLRMKMLRMMDKEKNTALHEAGRFGYLKVVKLLIHEDPGLSQFANEYGETPLYMAVARKFSHVASEIIQSTRELQVCGGPLGRTALHAATVRANTGIIKKLLKRFGDLTKHADQNGWTPLHLAAMERWGNLDVAKLLLEYDRDVAYMKDAKGKTPLHLAAYKSKASVMKLILSSCPDCCELVDESGWNVLHFIIKSPLHDKRERKIEAVLTNPLVTKLLNEKDIDGNTPLHHQSYTEDIEENLMDHRRVDKMALNKEKLTTYDIALSSARLPDAKTLDEAREYRKSLEHQVYITNKKKEKENQKKEELVKTTGVHLVVATLITPVTFAAGITLPGGFEGGNDQHPGSAVLR
ncbi:hypothetical protein CJ030_MR1G007957 [Morella rubra]|uniref:PGG domain-containing protein n=1 Tax=Morella rubra TaxID=262757 RepID=A0A6A1WVJ1_9ROSI|nr:hypothetical protein CJ030_MR1G007957 [Morella rubra]